MALATKIIELDLDKDQELGELSSEIKRKKIKIGKEEFGLKLLIGHSLADSVYAGYLLLLTSYFSKLIDESKEDKADVMYSDDFSKNLSFIYFKTFDVNKLESRIEKEFKVKIDLEKKNPLDEVFGIWKNDDISLEKIREKAWHRNN
jgi:hypothetical protein